MGLALVVSLDPLTDRKIPFPFDMVRRRELACRQKPVRERQPLILGQLRCFFEELLD